MILNTVVVVGDRFDPAMVPPEQFFGGAMDPGRIMIGPVAQFGYDSGRCKFSLNPSRIDLSVQSQEVMPEKLWSAAETLLHTLEKIRTAVNITGLGVNCDTAIPTTTKTGHDISNFLANLDLLKGVSGASSLQVSTVSKYILGPVGYTLRFEPETQSNGQNLFVAVNGHQEVDSSSTLMGKLKEFASFCKHVQDLHGNIRSTLL